MEPLGSTPFQMRLADLADRLGGRLCGPGERMICGVNTIRDASENELCFVTEDKHLPLPVSCRAAAVLITNEQPECTVPQVCVSNVQRALIEALKLFAPRLTAFEGIHPAASVEADAHIDPSAAISPGAYIGHGVRIGARTVIGPNCSIGQRTEIGSDCRLDSGVAVYHDCKIGNHCILLANAVIGGTGFGYSFIDGKHELIPHNGGVILEDGVEVGACSCVDRAKFGNTVIGAGTKIDNLVQVAHNVQTGKACLMAGQAGLGGSVELGDGVVLGGRAGVADHITIGSGTVVGVCGLVLQDLGPGRQVWGTPAQDLQAEKRSALLYQRLPEMAKEIKELRKKVAQLEAAENDKK